MKSGNFNFLEPSGPLQACNGIDLLFFFCIYIALVPHRKQNVYPLERSVIDDSRKYSVFVLRITQKTHTLCGKIQGLLWKYIQLDTYEWRPTFDKLYQMRPELSIARVLSWIAGRVGQAKWPGIWRFLHSFIYVLLYKIVCTHTELLNDIDNGKRCYIMALSNV